ncbi:MAG: hypothetical protein E4H14_15510 [Candidatus Thorarchaeota archaeon]|nr:MAG: hypothetical protein E4H14_15510 [Candidatus Thorarchaeota archaeon]
MHQRTTHHSPLFLGVMFILSLILLVTSITVRMAQDVGDNNPCIILAKSGVLYDLELYSLGNGTGHTIIMSFGFEQDADHRLEVQKQYIGSYEITTRDSTWDDDVSEFLSQARSKRVELAPVIEGMKTRSCIA